MLNYETRCLAAGIARTQYYSAQHAASFPERYLRDGDMLRERNRAWYRLNQERAIDYARERRRVIRREVIDHYGSKCACCGEASIEFLAIDHINGGGSAEFKRTGIQGFPRYQKLVRDGYPEGYRVLCHNCNHSYGMYGYCPHGALQ